MNYCSRFFLFLFFCGFSLNSNAKFLPDVVDFDFQIRFSQEQQISEAEFNSTINKIEMLYKPVVSKLGGRLDIKGHWKNDKVFAGAMQRFGGWNITINGGLARHPDLSQDALALIICHELGHHLAGFPIAPSEHPLASTWAAAEGQADYYSTHVCARKIWEKDFDKNSKFQNLVSNEAQRKCDSAWSAQNERDLCYRTSVAIESMTKTMSSLLNKPTPNFETPDLNIVEKTKYGHPAVQCRMDTALSGALCAAKWNESLIPGKKFKRDPVGLDAEKESASVTCTSTRNFTLGLRPACWFKARM